MSDEKIIEKLEEIQALLKIMANQEFQKFRLSILSTKNKEKIFDLCTGNNEMSEITKQAKISSESSPEKIIFEFDIESAPTTTAPTPTFTIYCISTSSGLGKYSITFLITSSLSFTLNSLSTKVIFNECATS